MPKQRQTCTRCSMRRQKCDRKTPCTRCVQNKEAHLCTTEWTNGYNPSIHRKYPRKSSPTSSQRSSTLPRDPLTSLNDSQPTEAGTQPWPVGNGNVSGQGLPTHLRTPGQPQEPTPSSTNLDFITFGRSDFSDISIGTLLSSKDAYTRNKGLMNESLNQSAYKGTYDDGSAQNGFPSGFSPAARAVEIYHIQSLLPSKDQVLQMTDYHERCMLYWSGGIYHGPSFRKSLNEAYDQSEELELRNLDWRWTALLFSILSSSIIGSSEAMSSSWGFSNDDKVRLARQWGTATLSCLNLGDFSSKYHIYSCQAVLNMHTSEHLVGSTKEWAVSQSAAIVIARGLGLHRLGPHPDDGKYAELNEEQKEALLQREIGRRVWYALASQDWLCSTSQGMYTIQRKHFTSIRPVCVHEETMAPIERDDIPTFTHVGNYLNDVAHLLITYHDDMLDAHDINTKYSIVLKYDARMRAMSMEHLPKVLSTRTPYNPTWPKWVAWARRLHSASCAHKLIMIHQSFLGRSFKDVRYTYSRWACATSAKTIIETMHCEREVEEPQWWVEQAFIVTSGICLALDLFHRSEKDPEIREHVSWVERCISILEHWPASSVAQHGVRLLTQLLQEFNKKIEAATARPNPANPQMQTPRPTPSFPDNISPAGLADAAAEASQAQAEVQASAEPEISATGEAWGPSNSGLDVDMLGFEDLVDTLPLEAGLTGMDNNVFFESMLSLANSQFY